MRLFPTPMKPIKYKFGCALFSFVGIMQNSVCGIDGIQVSFVDRDLRKRTILT